MVMKLKAIELFAGLGAMRLGLMQAFNEQNISVDIIETYEIKSAAIKQLKYFFKEDDIKDIYDFDYSKPKPFDILLAGFPCQPFSKAGLQKGFDDFRGNFIYEIIKILIHSKPRFFILENVDSLLTHNNGETFLTIIQLLTELNYNIDYKVLNLKDFNVPQSRKRLFIVGDFKSKILIEKNVINADIVFNNIKENVPELNSQYENLKFNTIIKKHYKNISSLQGKYLNDKRGGDKNIHSWDIDLYGITTPRQKNILTTILQERRKRIYASELNIPWKDGLPMTKSQIQRHFNDFNILDDLNELENLKYIKKSLLKPPNLFGYSILTGRLNFPFSYFIDNDGISNTLTATEMGKIGVYDNNRFRKISIREGLRLFGFPENYIMNPEIKLSSCYDLLGNSLGVPIIKHLSKSLIKNLTN